MCRLYTARPRHTLAAWPRRWCFLVSHFEYLSDGTDRLTVGHQTDALCCSLGAISVIIMMALFYV